MIKDGYAQDSTIIKKNIENIIAKNETFNHQVPGSTPGALTRTR